MLLPVTVKAPVSPAGNPVKVRSAAEKSVEPKVARV
jgi:hypothetical protein